LNSSGLNSFIRENNVVDLPDQVGQATNISQNLDFKTSFILALFASKNHIFSKFKILES